MSCFRLSACLYFRFFFCTALLALAAFPAHAAAVLRCDVTYAGTTQRIEARPVADPYSVASVDISGRFRFKAVMVGAAAQPEYVKLYAYFDTARGPLLIHAAKFLPPFDLAGGPLALTGEQRLYAGPAERELLYACALAGETP